MLCQCLALCLCAQPPFLPRCFYRIIQIPLPVGSLPTCHWQVSIPAFGHIPTPWRTTFFGLFLLLPALPPLLFLLHCPDTTSSLFTSTGLDTQFWPYSYPMAHHVRFLLFPNACNFCCSFRPRFPLLTVWQPACWGAILNLLLICALLITISLLSHLGKFTGS